jgi:hypothetical protein
MNKEIKRKSLKDGDVIELVIEDFGYVYMKYIDVINIFPQSSYPSLLRIYKSVYNAPVSPLTTLDRELLIAPLLIHGVKGIFKELNCKLIANEEVNSDEMILPDVKRGHPPLTGGFVEGNYEKMMVLRNLGDTDDYFFTKPKNVMHLEWSGAANISIIPFRIKLELLKLQGKDIKKEIGLKDWLEEEMYKRAINLPPYSKLDKSTRDFAIN